MLVQLDERILCVADVHGCYDELLLTLEKAKFDPDKDILVSLGDLTDRGPKSADVVEYFTKLNKRIVPCLIAIKGNHDIWCRKYLENSLDSQEKEFFARHGQKQTVASYADYTDQDKVRHLEFLKSQRNYQIIEYEHAPDAYTEAVFVHAGFNRHRFISDQDEDVLCWDRDLFLGSLGNANMIDESHKKYKYKNKDNFKEIFIGHTPTIHWNTKEPIFTNQIINLDTGCVFGGRLTVMDVRTKEYWQTDKL